MALPILAVIKRMAKTAEVRIRVRPDRRFKQARVADFESDVQRLGEDIAEKFREAIVGNIEDNRYGFTLADSTIKRKGGNETPLIEDGTMIGAIYRDEATVSVEDSPRDDSPLTNLELAIVHEYGTKDAHIPARPVWRNTFRDFEEVAKEMVTEFLETQKFKK